MVCRDCTGARFRTCLHPPSSSLSFPSSPLICPVSSYVSANYYVYPDSNLRTYLLHAWAERLNRLMLGCFHRSPSDVGTINSPLLLEKMIHSEELIREMVNEVKEYRLLVSQKMVPVQSNPSFFLVNKIYDYIDAVHPKIEEILDKFEKKLILERGIPPLYPPYSFPILEQYILRASPPGIPWNDEEKHLLQSLYQSAATDYNVNVLRYRLFVSRYFHFRREGADKREDILRAWSERISSLDSSRNPREVERRICSSRKEYRVYKENEAILYFYRRIICCRRRWPGVRGRRRRCPHWPSPLERIGWRRSTRR